MMLKRKALLILLILLVAVSPLSAKTISRIAAVVNNDIITTYELEQAFNKVLIATPNSDSLSPEQRKSLTDSTLDRLINDKLIEQRIKELELTVGEAEIDSAVENVRQQNNLTTEQMLQALNSQGMTMESYRERLKKEILNYKLVNREVYSKILVTSADARQYFDEHLEDYKVTWSISVNRLSFALQGDNRASQEQRLAESRKKLLKGEQFDELLADLQGDDISGGAMNNLMSTDLAEPIRDQLKDLKPGDVSEALELGGQLHLFQVTARDSGADTAFEKAKPSIVEKLQKDNSDMKFKEWSQGLRENAEIDIRI